jgi:hypothetical protein
VAFEPDIIVSDNDGTSLLLVAEVKSGRPPLHALKKTETQLKQYMIGMRCGVGMLVTPHKLRIYRDRYLGYEPDSIEMVGEFEFPVGTSGIESGRDVASRFEALVQHWLESLKDPNARVRLSSSLRDAIEEHVAPVLRSGEVRAAHHRHVPSGAPYRPRST